MERITGHLSYANVAATLALVLAMSGGAIAATGGFSSGGALRACVNEEGHLKLLEAGKHCGKGKKTVSWNQTGPKGATGAIGAAGANGKEGPLGPSAGFQAYKDDIGNFGGVQHPEPRVLGKLAVPAGSYMVTAKLVVSSQIAFVICRLENNETADADSSEANLQEQNGGSPGIQTMSLEASASFARPAEWMVKCEGNGSGGANASQLKIQAIQVASRSNLPA
jgi:hypothetical protein